MLYHLTLSLYDFKSVSFFPVNFTAHPSHKEDEVGSWLKHTDLFFFFLKHKSMMFVTIIIHSSILPKKHFFDSVSF